MGGRLGHGCSPGADVLLCMGLNSVPLQAETLSPRLPSHRACPLSPPRDSGSLASQSFSPSEEGTLRPTLDSDHLLTQSNRSAKEDSLTRKTPTRSRWLPPDGRIAGGCLFGNILYVKKLPEIFPGLTSTCSM